MDCTEDTVIVTGFGPFGDHKINASWETVKLLPSLNIEEEFGVKLVIHEIPVTYDYVAKNVPILWKEHNPMLVVHVGVSSLASGLTLEVQAHRSGYCRQDTLGKVPPRHEISSGKAEVIQPVFDVEDICKAVLESNTQVLTCCSADAGRNVWSYTSTSPVYHHGVDRDCQGHTHAQSYHATTCPQSAQTVEVCTKYNSLKHIVK